jgi:hypothetical protein
VGTEFIIQLNDYETDLITTVSIQTLVSAAVFNSGTVCYVLEFTFCCECGLRLQGLHDTPRRNVPSPDHPHAGNFNEFLQLITQTIRKLQNKDILLEIGHHNGFPKKQKPLHVEGEEINYGAPTNIASRPLQACQTRNDGHCQGLCTLMWSARIV